MENLEARAMLAVDLQNVVVSPTVINEGGSVTLSGQISAGNIVSVNQFTGGDPGEGLDMQGIFKYAVDTRTPATFVPVQVGNATFTSDNVAGVTLTTAGSIIDPPSWGAPDYGSSTSDDALEYVTSSIRHAGANDAVMSINMGNLVVGNRYKLQLIFAEACCADRGFDIRAEGNLIVDNFRVDAVQGGVISTAGAVATWEFTATDTELNVQLDGANTTFGDRNPIINGFTLEDLSVVFTPPTTTVGTYSGGDLGEGLDLEGTFAYAAAARGPAVGAIRDANFTDASAAGITLTSQHEILNWFVADFGASSNDDKLETVSQSIRWSADPNQINLDLASLIPGTRYKLQLLFQDTATNRGEDVFVEGVNIVDNLNAGGLQAAVNGNLRLNGAVVTHEFTAGDNTLNVRLLPPGGGFGDTNPILNGFTLEVLPPPPPVLTHTVNINWGDGSSTPINVVTGQSTFSANHTYVDNKPDGQAFGFFQTSVTATELATGDTDTAGTVAFGNALINRANNDGAVGFVFVSLRPITQSGRLVQWRMFDNDAAGLQITPILFQQVGANFVVRGVGTTRTSSGAGAQTFDFGLTAGSDQVEAGYFLGWKDVDTGVIDFDFGSPAGVRYFGNVAAGADANLGAGTFTDRDYSLEAVVNVLGVRVNDVAPTAVLGGPFSVGEGNNTVVLSATANDPANTLLGGTNDTVTFAWDLDNDGIFGETGAAAARGNETGASPTFNAAGVDGPGALPIAVRATDEDGLTGATATGSVSITNVNPTLNITGPATTSPGFTTTYTFTSSDVSPADQAGLFDYVIDWDDGTPVETFLDRPAVFTAQHAYSALGNFTISATTRDDDNGTSAADTLDVTVSPISVINGALIISGTDQNDRIVVSPGAGGASIKYNGKNAPVPSGFSTKIVIIGLEGNDTITINTSLGAPTEIFGGPGNDYITGGRGNDLIDGGDDSDRLFGAGGNDVLLGGAGNDVMSGGAGNDLLDGGLENDNLQGEAGNDTLLGGEGNDRALGGGGQDYLDGGDGSDRLDGGSGHDLLLGRAGGDLMYGGVGRDVLLGGLDGDVMYGGKDDDLLAGDTTTNDTNAALLASIWAQWSASGMSARAALAPNFNTTTIPVNDGFEVVYGELGADWFLGFMSDTVKDFKASQNDFKQVLDAP